MNIYKERILELRKLIDHYNDEYYINDKSVISDREFDNALRVTPSFGSPMIVTSPCTGSSRLSIVSDGLV